MKSKWITQKQERLLVHLPQNETFDPASAAGGDSLRRLPNIGKPNKKLLYQPALKR
jgi:hypothetical protein